MRSLGIISAFVLSASFGSGSQAQTSESTVCKNLRHCVDIVERHAPDSFDYRVLNGEFQRFGKKGKTALISMLASKDETDMRRAQAVLAKGQNLLTPDEQRKVAALWPRGNLDTHAKIMKSALSPLMRARVIETLSHENAEVRKLSRDIIAATTTRKRKMDFPLRPDDYGRLAKALLDDPTPALVELLSTFDSEKTKPVFMRLLQSTDGPTLSAAYQKLYEQSPEESFKTLVATLYGLKDTQAETAFAISYALRQRHPSREDGFYLKFAKDLAEDSEMSLMGRVAGFDAVLQSKDAPKLSDPSKFNRVIKTALQNHGVLPDNYLRHFPRHAAGKLKGSSDLWLTAFWNHLSPQVSEQKLDFIRQIAGFETNIAKNILIRALGDQGDWRIIEAAALPLGRMKYKGAVPQLEKLSNHPVMAVQVAVLTALDGIKNTASKNRAVYWQKTLSAQSNYCSAKPKDFKDDAKGLPFFDLIDLGFEAAGDKRRFVSTIAPTKNGFLVGFDAGAKGGDLRYYDNVSGDSTPLKTQLSDVTKNITAIIPVTPTPLGQYANAFWIVAQDTGLSDQAKLYRLNAVGERFKIKYQAELPHRVTALAPQPNGDVFMSFYKRGAKPSNVNPPLLLSPNGTIRRPCEQTADKAEALP